MSELLAELLEAIERPEWMRHANCHGADANLFYPDRGGNIDAALAICRGCPVQAQCLEYALDNGERMGIWGATTGRARRVMRKRRRQAA